VWSDRLLTDDLSDHTVQPNTENSAVGGWLNILGRSNEVDSMRAFPLTPRSLGPALILIALIAALGCSPSSRSPTDSKSTSANPPPVQAPMLWGDVKPVVSVKELMRDLIDPIADNVFDAVSVIVTKRGQQEKAPKTDEDWQRIQTGGVGIAEGAALLRIRRPFAPPGDLNNSVGPDAVELAPAQITAKIEKDPVEWNARVEALRNVGLEVLDIVKRRDVQELWDAGQNLDEACENCHRSYWYPGENAQFYEKLNRRSEQFRLEGSRGGKQQRAK
jgi:hypothetical protein